MKSLKTPLFKVNKEGIETYGGAQKWYDKKYIQESACGVIACTNLLFQQDDSVSNKGVLDYSEYMKLANKMKRYILVLPRFGVNGLWMALGLKIYFLAHNMPYNCHWGCRRKNRDKEIEKMLSNNLPVVLAIGPNFPLLFGRKKVALYRKIDGKYVSKYMVNAHYVSVTGMDEEWYQVSSWGMELYINKKEFDDYIRKSSLSLFSSILVVRKKK